MSFNQQQIAPPKSWDEFEDLCLALFRAEWKDSAAQKNGRAGQSQAGVDIFGINHAQGGGLWGVTCKSKNRDSANKLTKQEIDHELAKVDTFQPQLAYWIIATTAANDVVLQEYVRKLSAQRMAKQLCPVTVFFWDTIEQLLNKHLDVAERFYPYHFRPIAKPLHLPATSLSAWFSDPLDHLTALHQQLATSGSSALLTTVRGMGGVGKTQLALKYSLTFQDDYAGVWWFQAETANLLEQDCMLFCYKQGLPLAPGVSPAKAMNAWLAGQPRWLLVYDNAEDGELLRTCLPQAGPHHVLITSRRHDWEGSATLTLDAWGEEPALLFLRPRLAAMAAETNADDKQFDVQLCALTVALGGLPLALEQACAYLIKNKVPIQDYVQHIQEHANELGLLGRNDPGFNTRSVLATLSLAFAKLSEPARVLMGLCAWLATAPIPEYLFTENPDTLPSALQPLVANESAWRETVAELESYALCQARFIRTTDHMGNGAVDVRCLIFHCVTQAAVRASEHGAQAGGPALALVRAAFPTYAEAPEHWPRCRTLMPQVQCLQELYQADWQEAPRYASLLVQLARYLKSGPAMYRQAERLERQALLIRQNSLGEEHPDTLTSLDNLAQTLWQMGNLADSLTLQEDALKIRHRMMDAVLHSLGDTHAALNHTFTFVQADEDKLDPAQFRALHRTWLQNVTLTQFRCFSTLEIDLSEQLTVLIAPNGAGKTAVLDGIAVAIGLFVQCFQGGKAIPLQDTDARLLPTNPALGLMEPQYPVKVTAQGELDGKKLNWQYYRESANAAPTLDGAKQITAIGKAMQHAVTRQQPVVLPLVACFSTNRLQKKRDANEKSADQQFDTSFFSRTAGYKDCLDPATNYKEFEIWLTWAARADEDPPSPTAESADAATAGFAPLLKAVSNAVNTCLATSGWQNLRLSRKRMRLVMTHPLQGELEIAQLSDGVRNMIALVADIAQRAVRLNPHFGADAATKTPGLVLIDEVDLHLHPEWQQTVLTNLLAAFPNMQFVVTTHSPQVLTSVQPECIRRIEWDKNQAHLRQPEFSLGAESPQLLRSLQGVNPRPQHLPIVQKLNRYLALTSEDKWDSDEALALREELNAWGKAYEPSLVKADLDIRLRTLRRERR